MGSEPHLKNRPKPHILGENKHHFSTRFTPLGQLIPDQEVLITPWFKAGLGNNCQKGENCCSSCVSHLSARFSPLHRGNRQGWHTFFTGITENKV